MEDRGAIIASGSLESMRELQRVLVSSGLAARIVAGADAPPSA